MGISYNARWKGKTVFVAVTKEHVKVKISGDDNMVYDIVIFNNRYELKVNMELVIRMEVYEH